MVLAVPSACLDELFELARSEDVECTDLGQFTDSGRLELFYAGQQVSDLDMGFLHGGRPAWVRRSTFERATSSAPDLSAAPPAGQILREILAAPNVA